MQKYTMTSRNKGCEEINQTGRGGGGVVCEMRWYLVFRGGHQGRPVGVKFQLKGDSKQHEVMWVM